ncbi:MAG: hypothetical protein LC792_04160, partial [Actinobacteria bacterium]|nr:hypothetical protein [Actinomycetota bacterium]
GLVVRVIVLAGGFVVVVAAGFVVVVAGRDVVVVDGAGAVVPELDGGASVAVVVETGNVVAVVSDEAVMSVASLPEATVTVECDPPQAASAANPKAAKADRNRSRPPIGGRAYNLEPFGRRLRAGGRDGLLPEAAPRIAGAARGRRS